MPGMRLNDEYLRRQPLIAKGCEKAVQQGTVKIKVKVDCNGPDLPVVAM
jgi:hypothetical protein